MLCCSKKSVPWWKIARVIRMLGNMTSFSSRFDSLSSSVHSNNLSSPPVLSCPPSFRLRVRYMKCKYGETKNEKRKKKTVNGTRKENETRKTKRKTSGVGGEKIRNTKREKIPWIDLYGSARRSERDSGGYRWSSRWRQGGGSRRGCVLSHFWLEDLLRDSKGSGWMKELPLQKLAHLRPLQRFRISLGVTDIIED